MGKATEEVGRDSGLKMSIEETIRIILREELAAFKSLGAPDDRLLTAAQAAEVLQMSARWLYKHADRLPYAVRLSPTVVRFSYSRIQEEIAKKLKMQGKLYGIR